MNEDLLPTFQKLFEVVHELREKCPWDRVQTKETLRHLTIEEVYEMGDAILKDDWQELKTELGDILLHVLFYARIGEEQGHFTTTDVIQTLIDKLIRRHPHIYGDLKADTAEEVTRNWEQIKMLEKKDDSKKSVLSGVPQGMPALIKAQRMQEKVASVGFDWAEPEQVWLKVQEELEELKVEALKHAATGENHERMEKEFGDLLFSLVNYARFLKVNPEDALEHTNRKFKNRFEYLEAKVNAVGGDLKAMSLAEMDVLWEESKQFFA
jgi:XTP/dITP diphosphohydrolase